MSNIEVCLFEKGDVGKIIELLDSVFNGWPHFDLTCAQIDHWKWKYEANPSKLYAVVVAIIDDKIIGHSGSIFNKCKVGERILLCEQGADFAVDENYRGYSVSSRLMDCKNEYIKENIRSGLKFHVTSNPMVIKRDIQRDYARFPNPIINYIRIKDVNLHFEKKNIDKKLLKRYGLKVLKSTNRLASSIKPNMKIDKNKLIFEIKKIKRFDDRIEQLWNDIKESYAFILERKQEYLNWRYCDPRGGDYIINQAENGEEILGFIVLRLNKYVKDYPVGVIVDLISLPDRLDVADALISDAMCFFDGNSINAVSAWTFKNHPYEKLMKRNSLMDSRARPSGFFEHFNLVERASDVKDCPADKFHFQMGDTDWI